MNKKVNMKKRNPRVTVCYTQEEYKKVMNDAKACGLKKSQFIHEASLNKVLNAIMTEKQADALISLKAARADLISIKNALKGATQEQRKRYFRNVEFMKAWIDGINSLIRRLAEIDSTFKR